MGEAGTNEKNKVPRPESGKAPFQYIYNVHPICRD